MAPTPQKTPGMFDPEALIAAQRRSFEAFTNAGQIVAEGMRACAERQAVMMQDAMRDLWGEMQSSGRSPAAAGDPADQMARMRTAFEKVTGQVQELSQLLLKVQGEAMSVLNACAAANVEALGGLAPDLAGLQKMAADAVDTASRQTSAAVDEMRKRMEQLERETKDAVSATSPTTEAEAPDKAAPRSRRSAGAKS